MEQTSWFYLISISLFLLLSKLFLRKRNKDNKLPPSPPSLPIIGHLHLIKEPLHRTLAHLSDRYGPIFTLQLGSRPVLVTSSPSAVEECLSKNDVVFANRPRLLAGKLLGYDYTTLGMSPYGDHWRDLRRLTTLQILSPARLNMFLRTRREEARTLVKNLFRRTSSGQSFVRVEMKSRIFEMSFNILVGMVAGKRYFGLTNDDEDFEEAIRFREIIGEVVELSSGASNLGDFLSILRWIDFGGVERRMLALRKKQDELFQGLVDEHRNKNKSGKTNTMIDSMLSLQDSEPERYSDDIIKGQILTMIVAGTDTSAVTIEWAMSLLLNHPEVLNKVRAELDDIIGRDRLVVEADLSNLPYLQCIINETLRLFPAAPLLLPHESSDDCIVGGFYVPRGTILFVNAWAIHRNTKLWEDPTSFKPERFERGGVGELNKLITFGMGRRGCPGAGLANRVVGLALAALIQCFEWERISENLVDMSEGKGLSMPKAKPLEAMCKVRERMINILSTI